MPPNIEFCGGDCLPLPPPRFHCLCTHTHMPADVGVCNDLLYTYTYTPADIGVCNGLLGSGPLIGVKVQQQPK